MNEEYDCVILGTGLTECIISGLMSVEGKKVLHMDRNPYYGGASASLQLNDLFQKFNAANPEAQAFGPSRDYNVDLIPKYIMAAGQLVKMLIHTGVTKYLEFKKVDGSYVMSGGRVEKVPATDSEALKSPLMGLFEKRRCGKFFLYVQDYEQENSATHKGMDLSKTLMKQVFEYFGLEKKTIDFIGHALALYRDDSYLDQPALPTVERIRLYVESIQRYGDSPYIYPLYGLGELPQGFSRLSAVYGGTFMLNKPFEGVVYDDNGRVVGVKSEGEVAKCKFVVADPSYFPDKVQESGKVIRAYCILNHPLPNTNNGNAGQIIIPQTQANRKSDIYILYLNATHNVAAKGRYIAIVSTTLETNNPEEEIAPGLALLGEVQKKFISVDPLYMPKSDGRTDGVFVSQSYDATSHFESTCDDVLDIYKRITGKDLEIKLPPPEEDHE
eukprot:TRINITY_DN1686_c0_g1::TRINITY_DN1686_c0_g1_i1::g.17745::m.17745 TRINITY_DN1686_c0_g1::TRINITY_DN1686_c0_g1_i1::g.17745  ORF type:complete len:442 (+),score=159.19,sp/P50395/GDIB_HUMAN/59.12/0.0,GDI/PF00996.13/4.9e-207 TRINITY_DN1686_c0_g1_i1:62-1387(+)